MWNIEAEMEFHQRNFKKLGNHKQGNNVSEIEIDGAKTVDKCNLQCIY